MNKIVTRINWVNDTDPAINDTHLNQMDQELDAIDDRVIAMETAVITQAENAEAWANGTRGGEAIAPSDPAYHKDAKYQAAQAASSASNAATSETNAGLSAVAAADSESYAAADALVSEGYAKGTQNGQPVGPSGPGSEYYENNAEFFKNQASAIVGPKVTSFNGRNNVVLPAKGDYNAAKIEFDPSTTSLPNTLDTLQDFLEYAYPPSVTVTLTLNGAKEDMISIYEAGTSVLVGSCAFASGQTSGTCQIDVPAGGGSYDFVSSVSKGITEETKQFDYSKTITLTDSLTQTVNIYPEHALYWYGNEIVAWVTSGYTNSGKNCYGGVKNTNDMYVAQTYDLSGIATYVGTADAISLDGYNTIKMRSKASAYSSSWSAALGINTTKDLGGGAFSYAIIPTGSDTSYHIGSADISNVSTSNYIFFAAGGNIRGGYSDAIWLE